MNAQVNVQTGSATFAIPMFQWQDSRSRLHFDMSLNYSSGSGLKVNDIASNVGQGWNLMAGGVVTRMQNGEPDDQYPHITGSVEQDDDLFKYPAGYLYNPDDVKTKGCPADLAKYPIFKDKNHIYRQKNAVAMDRELDYFAFNFNGKNGLFVLNKNNNTGFLLGDSKVKIRFVLSPTDLNYGTDKIIRTRISTFFIQDEDGLTYRFGTYKDNPALQLGLTKVMRTGYCHADGSQMLTQPKFKDGKVYYQGLFEDNATQYPYTKTTNPYIVNSWYLTEIIDSFTNRRILFSYGYKSVTDPVQIGISWNKEKNYSIISKKATQSEVPELLGIQFPDEQSTIYQRFLINVNYGANRLDVQGEKIISSIDIKYVNSNITRTAARYELKTSYFILNHYGTPSSDFEKSVARLCLLSVKKYGIDLKADDQPYLFDYYMGSNAADDFVPPYSFPVKDTWGYYNGSNSVAYNGAVLTSKPLSQLTIYDLDNNKCRGLCFMRNNVTGTVLNPKDGFAKNGLLRQIVYPTGGTVTYEYSQNTGIFRTETASGKVGGVHVSKISTTDGGYSNGCGNPVTTQYNYVNTDGSSSLWGIERPINTPPNPSKNHYAPTGQHYSWSWHNFPAGTCEYDYQYPGILYQEEKISTKWIQTAITVLSNVLDVVGIVMEIKELVTVLGGGSPVSLIIDVILSIGALLYSCLADASDDYTSTIYYDFDLNNINPLPAQFKRVEIIPNTGDIGKTIQVFTSSDQYPLWLGGNPNLLKQQRYGYWEYGLPKLITTLDKDGNKIKEVEYNYEDIKHGYDCNTGQNIQTEMTTMAVPNCKPISSCNCEVLINSSQRSDAWFNDVSFIPTSTTNLRVNTFDFFSGRLNLTDTYERSFKPGSTQYLQTATHYDYDDNNSFALNALNISKITTIQSNGDTLYKYIKYAGDFSGTAVDDLNANNCISTPVSTVSSVARLNGTEKFLGEKVTEFTTSATGNIVASRTLEQRFTSPQSALMVYKGPGNAANPPYKQTQTFIYNAAGNLAGMKDEGNHTVANIYDYTDKYVVATVANADPLVDKPVYTSFETQGYYGGWAFTGGSPVYNTAKAVTGIQSLDLAAGFNLKATGLNTSKAYKLSFWATTTVTVSGGATLVISAPVIRGFTYYEYNIAQGTASVTLSGTATIDELRLYPETARMNTTAYNPLIGKISECDKNNHVTYYEYDNLGRLQFIKDEKKNIVKMYEYSIVSNKQAGCPGTYSNRLITEAFTKSNCSTGYQGNLVSYTVPAGKYTSTISQADADMKAENEINKYGQDNADNTAGACSLIYYNAGKSAIFYKQGCSVSQYGSSVTYTVPAHKYNSIISQAEVDEMEQDEIDANGQANANVKGTCIATTDPYYRADYPASTRCQTDAYGSKTGHIEVLMTDVNPNSVTYNNTTWKDGGVNEETCPHDPGEFPSLEVTGYTSNKNGHGVRIYNAGTLVKVVVTLNSSNSTGTLTGTISGTGGGFVNLSGVGNPTQTFWVTAPVEGYISWNLYLSGNKGTSDYISSNIQFTPQ